MIIMCISFVSKVYYKGPFFFRDLILKMKRIYHGLVCYWPIDFFSYQQKGC